MDYIDSIISSEGEFVLPIVFLSKKETGDIQLMQVHWLSISCETKRTNQSCIKGV